MKLLPVLLISFMLVLNVSPLQAGEKIVIDGSTTVGPIAKAFAEYYMSLNKDVNITVSESGSGNGAKSLINSTCDVADMSRLQMRPYGSKYRNSIEACAAYGRASVPRR